MNVCINYRQGNKNRYIKFWRKKCNLYSKFLHSTCLIIDYHCAIDSCYLIKYKAEQRHLWPSFVTNDKLKEVWYWNITRMRSKDELKEFEIKSCMCYYFDEMMRVRDINLNDILL